MRIGLTTNPPSYPTVIGKTRWKKPQKNAFGFEMIPPGEGSPGPDFQNCQYYIPNAVTNYYKFFFLL